MLLHVWRAIVQTVVRGNGLLFISQTPLLRLSAPSPELVISAKWLVAEESVLSAGERERPSETCDGYPATPLPKCTVTPAVVVAMRTGDWDCMPVIVWAVHFAWSARGRRLIRGYSCVPLGAISAVGTGPCCLRDFSVKPGTVSRPLPPSQAARQYSLLSVIRGSYCSSAGNLCGHFSWSHVCYLFHFLFFQGFFFLKVAACGALHMIPVWSCWREMDLFCGGVKHEETQKNVNVGGRRDRPCEAFISLQLNNSNVLLRLNKVCLVFFFVFFASLQTGSLFPPQL